jgi:HD-like signal output (HDOD) protein
MSSDNNQKFDVKAFALELREDIAGNRIKLPTLPAISLEALLVVNDAASSMADVSRIVSKDTSMAARLVRYANSPLYRGINNVSSVKAAITRIGIDAVKHAILSLAMRDVFTTAYKPIQVRMESLWQHSVAVASRAALLAGYFPHLNKDEAMLAGLIHDVGVIPILIKAKDFPMLLEKEERLDKVIQALHMNLGRFMLTHWSFDQTMVEVAGTHDKFDRQPPADQVDYVDLVQVANVLSYADSDHRYAGIDHSKIPAFQRVGMARVAEVEQQIAEGGEREISSMLH